MTESGEPVFTEEPVIRYNRGRTEHLTDKVIREGWLELYLNGRFLSGIPVTDRDIPELIHGILYTEGYIRPGERAEIRRSGSICRISLVRDVRVVPQTNQADCAFSRIDLGEDITPLAGTTSWAPEKLLDLVNRFQHLPSVYHETGGVHMAAFAREEILHWADDISRRNAVDKVIGRCFLHSEELSSGLMITSGRISSDIVYRILKAGIPVILSLSAPTERALRLARHYGITVCGFARGKRMNIYTHPERIITASG